MRVLVTGGAGFIGSHIVELLDANGHTPIVFDKKLGRGLMEIVPEDVRDIDAVCHQASMLGTGAAFDDLEDFVWQNVDGTAALLTTLHRVRFRGPLVLASSIVVYGEGGIVPINEDHCLYPRSIYATTKVAQEHICRLYGEQHGSPVTMLRYHNVYGPRMPRRTEYCGVAAVFHDALQQGDPPHVFEDGGQTRDFVHVSDVAQANLLALENPYNGPLNIASGYPVTILEVARAMGEPYGIEPIVTGEKRVGDVRHVVCTPARAISRLGYQPQVKPLEGLRNLWA